MVDWKAKFVTFLDGLKGKTIDRVDSSVGCFTLVFTDGTAAIVASDDDDVDADLDRAPRLWEARRLNLITMEEHDAIVAEEKAMAAAAALDKRRELFDKLKLEFEGPPAAAA